MARTIEINTDMLPVKFPADTEAELAAIAAFLSGQRFVQSTQVGKLTATPDAGTVAARFNREPVTLDVFVECGSKTVDDPDSAYYGESLDTGVRYLAVGDEKLVSWHHDPTLDPDPAPDNA